MTTSTKVCSTCGVDLNGQKRVKDAAGVYFCRPCWASVAKASVTSPSSTSTGSISAVESSEVREPEPLTKFEVVLQSVWTIIKRVPRASLLAIGAAMTKPRELPIQRSPQPSPRGAFTPPSTQTATPGFIPPRTEKVPRFANRSPDAPAMAGEASNRTCRNCGSAFGSLEQGIEWHGHRVCATCISSLQAEEEEHSRVEAENAQRAYAESQRAVEEAQEKQKREALASQARWGQIKSLAGVAIFGLLTVALLVVPLFASKDENSHDDGAYWWWFWFSLFGVSTFLSFLQYRRLGKQLAAGDAGAILRNPTGGVPGIIGTPILIMLGLAILTLGAYLGIAGGLKFYSSFMEQNSPDSLARWCGGVLGFCIGCCVVAGIWGYCDQSFCPACRRYFVAAILGSEHVGTDVRNYTRNKRIYTKDIGGNILTTTDIPVQHQEITETRRVFCRCRNCRHEWAALRRLTRNT